MRSLVITAVLASSALVRADGVKDADSLFDEGQKLRAAGNKTGACEKFEGALKANPNAVGAILNVGLCREETGKYASAVKLFTTARDLAVEHKLEPERQAAEEHLVVDEPRIATIALAFMEKPIEGTTLVVDDEVVQLDKADKVPVDPGSRTVVVSAPGRVSWRTTVVLKERESKAIGVPRLAEPVVYKRTGATYGKVITFVGVGLLATASGFALYARSMYNTEFDKMHCSNATNPPSCDSEGYKNTHTAHTLGNVATGLAITGGIAVGVGAVLWFVGTKERPEPAGALAVTPALGPDLTGIVATGRF